MRSRSHPLDATTAARLDLHDIARGDGLLFVRDGVGMAGRGVAARIAIDESVDFLRALEPDGPDHAPRAVAIGTIPFTPGSAGTLTVPAVTVVKRADGTTWVIEVDGGDDAPDLAAALAPVERPRPRAQEFSVRPVTPVDRYLRAVTAARDAVRSGSLAKAVIAREIEVSSPEPIDVHAVLLRLKAAFGRSHRYSIDGFIGASPELLVAVEGSAVRSHPLAGTTPRTGDPETDQLAAAELLASEKNQIEHRVVIDMIHDTLLPWCSYLDWEPEPSIVTVANVQHLGTAMEGHLCDPRPDAITLVRALSPTPALGGFPRDAALELIAREEGFDRGRYGGAVGWVDAHGDGTWAVAIRCAELSPDRRAARLVGGGGIVADSDPLAELAETQAKLQAMLSAIIRA